jgi:Fibronectin type III domain
MWAAPVNDGGARISDYVIQPSTSRTGPWRTVADGVSAAHRFTVTGLTNGTRYFFRVAPHIAAGTGAVSAIVSATPQT